MTDEAQRQRVLDRYRIVDSLPEAAYQDIVQIAAALCDTPIALLSLLDRDRQWFKARIGLELPQTERSQAVCDHAIREPKQLLEVPDLADDPRFANISVVRGDTGARFYAGMPLVTDEGVALGTVCVLDTAPRQLSDAQRDGLRALARTTMRLLDERRNALQREREAILQAHPAASVDAAADGRYRVVILEVQELAALAERQSERLLGSSLQQLDRTLASYVHDGGADTVDRATEHAEFIVMLHGADAEQKLRGLREIAARQQALGLTVLVGDAQATRADEPIGQVFLRAEAALSAEKDRQRLQTP
ncbi:MULTISPECIES: GAF domain-containing protein [Xanthomonas]|uniref:GAF domain-containing protein n=1 Tax=Xanthomonas TaxID=338 RepID=UPI001ADC168A|nr:MULTISPECIES: GAF domain-containing protein [unclassified Xanthomonas]MBO9874505.1 GAF domain-containing protein [Xanthomonas sp. D-93]WNH44513.1 GAF domain-containing protein [Xanthomonas sp. A6251]